MPTEDLNICDGLSQATSPRFNTIMERSKMSSPNVVPQTETTATSLSEMHFTPAKKVKPSTPWTPNATMQDSSQMPLVTESPSKFARFAFLAK